MRHTSILLISLFLLGCFSSDIPERCNNISISTQLKEDGEFAYDVLNKGQLNPEWIYDDETIKDSDSTELDFLYITVFGKHDKLTKKNFQIKTNSSEIVSNTTIFVEKVVDLVDNKTYSVRINYKCNKDASAMMKLDFQISIIRDLCPTPSNIFWTRKCGDSEPPRMGLQVDYNINHKYNHTVVQNGMLIDADYFSEDYEDWVLRIPKRTKYSLFFASLNITKEMYAHNDLTIEEIDLIFKSKDPEIKLQTHQLQLENKLNIDKITMNYDQQILEVDLKGPIVNGGSITSEPSPIYLEYKCRRGGVSGVQLTFEMEYFRNVNIFFEKECPLQPGEGSGVFGTIAFFILIFFIVIIIVTLYNVFALEITGVKAVPFAVPVLSGLSKIPGVKGTLIGDKLYYLANPIYQSNTLKQDSVNTVSSQVSQDERELNNSEFKIKNITEKDEESNLDDSVVTSGNNVAPQVGNYGSI
ncbi:hypothetical protein ABPG72_016755 [Tetrahymena utriculariae]